MNPSDDNNPFDVLVSRWRTFIFRGRSKGWSRYLALRRSIGARLSARGALQPAGEQHPIVARPLCARFMAFPASVFHPQSIHARNGLPVASALDSNAVSVMMKVRRDQKSTSKGYLFVPLSVPPYP